MKQRAAECSYNIGTANSNHVITLDGSNMKGGTIG